MNSKNLILFLTVALLAGIILGGTAIYLFTRNNSPSNSGATVAGDEHEHQLYSCGMHPNVISEEPGDCPICGMKLTPIRGGEDSRGSGSKKGKGKILYWRAPMDPSYISETPGKSPMGMDLVPVYEGEEGGGSGSILIDPTTVQNMGIKLAPVQRRDMQRTIRAVGTITYNEENLYVVNSKISGWIEKLFVNSTGQQVKKGEPLLEIYSPDLVSAQEEYLLAIKNADAVQTSAFAEIKNGAQSLLKSSRQRLENWDIPDETIRQLKTRGSVTKTMTLVAPATGVVTHKNAVEGVYVKEGMDLYRIADLSNIWVDVSIYEQEIPWVKVGQQAEMTLSYVPGKIYTGKVTYIYPYLDKKARDVKVRLEFPNPNLELKPDMYVNVMLLSGAEKNVLVIPTESVIRSGRRNIVFVEREEGKFEPREIKIGLEGSDGYLQVLSGLLEGEQIVTSGQFLLDSESNAQEAIKKMLDAKRQAKSDKKEMTGEKDHKDMSTMGKSENQSAGHEGQAHSTESHEAHSHESNALYTCPMHPDFVTDDPNQRCPDCGMKLDKKKDLKEDTQLYTCPMHPEFVTDDPDGRCSICGMKLEKKQRKIKD